MLIVLLISIHLSYDQLITTAIGYKACIDKLYDGSDITSYENEFL